MAVREINDPAQLASLRADWERLLEQTLGASFWHTLEWLTAYWKHYGDGQRLRVLVVESSGRVEAIVPLVVRSEATRVGRLRVLTYPLHDWGSFYSPLGPASIDSLAAAMAHLRSTPRDWDLFDLRWLASDELDGIAEAMRQAGFPPLQQPWSQTALVEMTGFDWHAYWASRGSAWRNNVRRSYRKLSENYEVRYLRYRCDSSGEPMDPRWDLYETCVELAGRSWQSNATDGTTLSHAQVRDFLRDAHAAAAHRGAIDINLLYLNDRPAAFAYNYAWRGWVYGLRMGFDAALTRDGAGTVLMEHMLRDSFLRGDRVFDLGAGYLEAKRAWRTCERYIYRSTHFALPAPRAQLLRAKHWLQKWLAGDALGLGAKLPSGGSGL